MIVIAVRNRKSIYYIGEVNITVSGDFVYISSNGIANIDGICWNETRYDVFHKMDIISINLVEQE